MKKVLKIAAPMVAIVAMVSFSFTNQADAACLADPDINVYDCLPGGNCVVSSGSTCYEHQGGEGDLGVQ